MQYFARIGPDLFIEATSNGMSLRTTNKSKSAYAIITFHTSFFIDYQITEPDDNDEYANKCKISMKSCVNIFRNMKQVGNLVSY